MFASLGADLAGTSDNCTILDRSRFSTEGAECMSFLLPGEVPYIVMKAKVQQHMFTDQAYIRIMRDNINGTKQLVERYPFSKYRLTDSVFVTAGLGMSDLDCNIRFVLGSKSFEIEIRKVEQESAKRIFNFLSFFETVLDENARLHAAMNQDVLGLKSIMPTISTSDMGPFLNVLASQKEAMNRRFFPMSYRQIFESFFPST